MNQNVDYNLKKYISLDRIVSRISNYKARNYSHFVASFFGYSSFVLYANEVHIDEKPKTRY